MQYIFHTILDGIEHTNRWQYVFVWFQSCVFLTFYLVLCASIYFNFDFALSHANDSNIVNTAHLQEGLQLEQLSATLTRIMRQMNILNELNEFMEQLYVWIKNWFLVGRIHAIEYAELYVHRKIKDRGLYLYHSVSLKITFFWNSYDNKFH